MFRKIAVVAALVILAGCQAQGSPTVPLAGLLPQAIVDVATVTTNSTNNTIAALGNDVDTSGTGLTITAVAVDQVLPSATGAAASTNGQTVNFTPPANFVGVVTLQYTIVDGKGAAAASQIVVTVLPAALLPVALPDAATVLQDAAATDIDVLANDVDPAGGGLTVTAVSVTSSLPPAAHAVSISGNKVRFTPAAGFAGVVVVTYTVTDVNSNTADGVLSILVSPLDLAVGPVPLPDAAVVAQNSAATDIDVLANDLDPVGGGLTVTAASVTASLPPAAHTVSISGNKVRFTPAAGFAGVVVVAYTAQDADGNTANGVLNIVVSPLALAVGPVAVPDAATVAQDSAATDIAVLANDVDPAAGGLTLTLASVAASVPGAAHTVAISGNKVRFTPAAGFAGAVVVSYTAQDVNGNTANGLLNIVVTPVSLAVGPVAVPDAAVVAEDSAATDLTVVANDVDTAGGGLTLTAASVAASVPSGAHTVTLSGNKVRFTPAAGFAGAVVVSYTIQDANGVTANGVLDITVSPTALTLNPVAVPDAAVVAQDSAATDIAVVANDVDIAGGGLTLTAAVVTTSLPAATHTVSISGNKVRFTPAASFSGVVVVGYTIQDVNGKSSNGVLDITVTPTALTLSPVAVPDVGTAQSSLGAQLFDVVANDVDPAGGGLTLTLVSISSQVPAGAGSVAIVSNKVQYTPTALYIGSVLIQYTAQDVNGKTTTGQLSLTVTL